MSTPSANIPKKFLTEEETEQFNKAIKTLEINKPHFENDPIFPKGSLEYVLLEEKDDKKVILFIANVIEKQGGDEKLVAIIKHNIDKIEEDENPSENNNIKAYKNYLVGLIKSEKPELGKNLEAAETFNKVKEFFKNTDLPPSGIKTLGQFLKEPLIDTKHKLRVLKGGLEKLTTNPFLLESVLSTLDKESLKSFMYENYAVLKPVLQDMNLDKPSLSNAKAAFSEVKTALKEEIKIQNPEATSKEQQERIENINKHFLESSAKEQDKPKKEQLPSFKESQENEETAIHKATDVNLDEKSVKETMKTNKPVDDGAWKVLKNKISEANQGKKVLDSANSLQIVETDNTIKREPDGCVSVNSTKVPPLYEEMVKNFRLTGDNICVLDKVRNAEDASKFIMELAKEPPIKPIIKDDKILEELKNNPKYKEALTIYQKLTHDLDNGNDNKQKSRP